MDYMNSTPLEWYLAAPHLEVHVAWVEVFAAPENDEALQYNKCFATFIYADLCFQKLN